MVEVVDAVGRVVVDKLVTDRPPDRPVQGDGLNELVDRAGLGKRVRLDDDNDLFLWLSRSLVGRLSSSRPQKSQP